MLYKPSRLKVSTVLKCKLQARQKIPCVGNFHFNKCTTSYPETTSHAKTCKISHSSSTTFFFHRKLGDINTLYLNQLCVRAESSLTVWS